MKRLWTQKKITRRSALEGLGIADVKNRKWQQAGKRLRYGEIRNLNFALNICE
jgi:hypothetical protein